jgi:hypothetical protein
VRHGPAARPRLRPGDWLALGSACWLFAMLFLDWFGHRSGWASAGWALVALLVLCASLGVWLAVAAAVTTTAHAIAACVFAAALAPIGFLVTLIRLLTAGAGVDAGAYLGLAAVAVLSFGAWWAMKDDRARVAGSESGPPAARPAPPAAGGVAGGTL